MQYLIKISGLNTADDMDSKGMSLLWKTKSPFLLQTWSLATLEGNYLEYFCLTRSSWALHITEHCQIFVTGGSMLPAFGCMCWWLHRQFAAAGWAETNARKGPEFGRGHPSASDLTSAGQEPARGPAQGDGAPLGGLLLQSRTAPCWHVQGFQHGWQLLPSQHCFLGADWPTR